MEALALSLESSRHCCDMVAEGGGTAALLRLVQSAGAGRDKGCLDGLRWALLCLAHLCRYRPYAEAVFSAEGLLQLLGEQLVATRDKEVGAGWEEGCASDWLSLFLLPPAAAACSHRKAPTPLLKNTPADCLWRRRCSWRPRRCCSGWWQMRAARRR